MSKNDQIQFKELVYLSVSCESSIIPKYLYSWTTDNYLPATATSGSGSLFADFEEKNNNMNTVLLILRCKH